MYFQQLFESESSTYTYILGCNQTKDAIIIDPVFETIERDYKLINELGFKLIYSIETHIHADHITGAFGLKQKTACQTIVSKHATVKCADIYVKENDQIHFGNHHLTVLETQGHTSTCLSFVTKDMVFTGDLLFVRGTGRTDFQQGDPRLMYKNIIEKIFTLPDSTRIYPGHDYKGISFSTVGEEKKFNPRVGANRSESEFVKIMNELNLSLPKKINEAVPANLKCGQF